MMKASILAVVIAAQTTMAFPCSLGLPPDLRGLGDGEAFEATVTQYDKIAYPIPKFPNHEVARFELAITANLDGKPVSAKNITAYAMWPNFKVPAKWNGPAKIIVAVHDQIEPDGQRVFEFGDVSCGASAIIEDSESNRQAVRAVRVLKAKHGKNFWRKTEPMRMP